MLERPFPVVQVDAEERAGVGEHRDRLVVEVRAVLDRARAGPDRPLRAFGAVRVDGDERVVPGGLLDRGAQLGLAELGRAGDAAAGQHRPRPDALDEVGATDQQASDPLADLVDRAHDAEPQVLGQARCRGRGRRRRRHPTAR